MKPAFKYAAKVIKVIDGDTIDCVIDLGFYVSTHERFRLYGIDTPEKTSKNATVKKLAFDASKYVTDTIQGKDIILECFGKDKYGRWLAIVTFNDVNLNDHLIELGFAKAYLGGNKNDLNWDGQPDVTPPPDPVPVPDPVVPPV